MKKFIASICIFLMTACSTVSDTVHNKYSVGELYEKALTHAGKVHIECIKFCGSGSGTMFRTLKSDKYYVLTNAHVLLDETENKLVSKAYFEFSDGFTIKIKPLVHGVPGGRTDIAIAEVVGYKVGDLEERAILLSDNNINNNIPKVHEHVMWVGAPYGVNNVLSSGYAATPNFLFTGAGYFMDGMSRPGNSGSVIYDLNGNIAGMVWGMTGNGEWAISVHPYEIETMLHNIKLL